EWGFRNLGELSIATPNNAPLAPVQNDDGTPWDPFGYYRKNTGHEGMGFTTDNLWQADWTMDEGNVTFDENYPNPPQGSRMRLTMAAAPQTRITTAWLTGPARNDKAKLRQDFLVAKRAGSDALFVDTLEPISGNASPLIRAVET